MISTIVLLIFMLIVQAVIVRKLWSQNNKLYDINQNLSDMFQQAYIQTVNIYDIMKQLDNRQMFQSDDQVGVLWKDIATLIQNWKRNIDIYNGKDIESQEETRTNG